MRVRGAAAYPGSNFPEYVFPSIVGRPILRTEERESISANGVEIKDLMVGDEAEAVRSYLQVSQPMEHGIVKDFEDMRHGTSPCLTQCGTIRSMKSCASTRAAARYSSRSRR